MQGEIDYEYCNHTIGHHNSVVLVIHFFKKIKFCIIVLEIGVVYEELFDTISTLTTRKTYRDSIAHMLVICKKSIVKP